MKEQLYTIPVNDAFESDCECPLCRMKQELEKIFVKLNLDTKFASVKVSDRPDLSDFQCNGALALAKMERKNPREIAQAIVNELQECAYIDIISIDGPGFINIKLKNNIQGKV